MNYTPLIAPFFKSRAHRIENYATNAVQMQEAIFHSLLHKAAKTAWGWQYDYSSIKTYEDYKQRVPLQNYDDIKPYVERVRHGERDVLWRGQTKWFAKSSGTTNDKSKFLPITADSLRTIHYRGGVDCVSVYTHLINPQSRIFSGKALILGGSHAPNYNLADSLVGDLSAILIENASPLVQLLRVPSRKIALMDEWEAKLEALVKSTLHRNITNMSGVPSWFLVLIKRILQETGRQSLEEVWPNIEVFFHGGVSFAPYREQYAEVIRTPRMHYVETYNASEGFFGIQSDLSDPAMLLMTDYGMFYEFMPMTDFGSPNPRTVMLQDVEIGCNYALILNNCSGLWRYMIGDTIKFTSKDPYKFVITGRTRHFINAFGEELMVDNADKALVEACKATEASIIDYTAAPVFMDSRAKCSHQWLIEFDKQPADLQEFTKLLDEALKRLNSDYEAKRHKDIALQLPKIEIARKGLFHDWLAMKGKLGGQHKVPRLSNDRVYIDELLLM